MEKNINKISRRDFLNLAGKVGSFALLGGLGVVQVEAQEDTSLPHFDKNSDVLLSPSGKIAIMTNGKPVTPWIDSSPNETIETAGGGGVRILYEYKGNKPIGVIGFAYSGGITENGADNRSGRLVPSTMILPDFDSNSKVIVSRSGQVAIQNNDQIVTDWMDPDQIILTSDGQLTILSHTSGGKKIGPLYGFSYSDNNPDNGSVDRTGHLTQYQHQN